MRPLSAAADNGIPRDKCGTHRIKLTTEEDKAHALSAMADKAWGTHKFKAKTAQGYCTLR